jgi:hypothetical protein
MCWKFGEAQFAVRNADWKLVKVQADKGLYDVSKDIGETADRTAEQAKLAEDLKMQWDNWDARNAKVSLNVEDRKNARKSGNTRAPGKQKQ